MIVDDLFNSKFANQVVAEAGNKPLEKSRFGTGDTRTPRDIKSQMSGASDEFVKSTADKTTGPFHSKVAKMQGKMAKSELRKREQGMAEGLNEFASAPNPGGENYLQALASAWYNGTFNTGNLHKGIKSQEDVERILERGIHCGDGKIRKYSIGYNSNFDGVEIQSDDHYEHADYDDAGRDIDSRTGKPWGPYDVVEFSDNELDESDEQGVAEGSLEEDEYDKMLRDLSKARPDLTKKYAKDVQKSKDIESGKELNKLVKKNPGVLKTYSDAVKRDKKLGVAEGLNEFAVSGDSGGDDDSLFNYAKMWYNGDLKTQRQVEKALQKAGLDIGENEDENGGAYISDLSGDYYESWTAEDLEQGVAEGQLDEIDWKGWQDKMKAASKGAKQFTKNVRDTGNAAAGMINAYGGAGKELGNQLIARPTSAAYNAAKGGLNKAAGVAKGVYGDVKQGAQNVGQATDTVATDVGNAGTWAGDKIKQAGRGVANVVGGTARGVGSVAGGATTGIGRAGVKGFNTGVQNVGGNAVGLDETNIFKPTSDPVEIKKQIDLKKQEIANLETQLKTAGVSKTASTRLANPATGRDYTNAELAARPLNKFHPDYVAPTAVAPAQTAPGEDPNKADYVGRREAARRQAARAAAPAPAPSFAAPNAGYSNTNYAPGVSTGVNAPIPQYKTNLPATAQAKPSRAQQDAYHKAIGAPTLPEHRIVNALKRPVAEMLQMVKTKEDVQRIKQFVDQTFTRHSTVSESEIAVRNQLIEYVVKIGAQRRREHSQQVAQ